MRFHRGLTWVGFLLLAVVAGAFFWLFTFGEVYWDNFEVSGVLRQAAARCYNTDDEHVKAFVFGKLHDIFDVEVEDRSGRRVKVLKIDIAEDDLHIERNQVPAWVHIWLTYNRTVKVPLIGYTRTLRFDNYAEQDLTPVKW
jgi:hypothetical protein